ncbi:META domain-containing protein [Synechococcus sp. J7-Johnson]|uniref:META domain-containing protein n=1 Tax=Synechococcus sp. J7-Johnson TaxID=2823737 RepID=UPI0020CB7E74|nr:META domain-containing protein [Synechococcus sp. J7-Johnson]MCP9840827.1 META domain-containing protein [Synechococcus sp. J7-Johnson]
MARKALALVLAAVTVTAATLLPGAAGRSQAKPATAAPLAGTQWRLVEMQSMDDAQGTTRPADPSRYTLQFNGDGTVQLRLDCNRANGGWSAQPSADPSSGSLRLGPLATTRALCPPPSLGEKLGAQAAFVRGYRLNDGRLTLSLLADGGLLVWEPVQPAGQFSASPDPKLEAAIMRASPDVMGQGNAGEQGASRTRYVHARYDLNGDGSEEVFVYLMGPAFCGTGGCTLQIFRQSGIEYHLIDSWAITRLPIIVSAQRTRGWQDLWKRESGGGAPTTYLRHTFDGQRYVEQERVPAEPTPAGTPILVGDPGFADGLPLLPSR